MYDPVSYLIDLVLNIIDNQSKIIAQLCFYTLLFTNNL